MLYIHMIIMQANSAALGVIGQLEGSSLTDPNKQAEVYAYLENLKNDSVGWQKSVDNIITNNISGIEENFLLLQVIEDFLKRRYASCGITEQSIVKGLLSNWMDKIASDQQLPVFLINKMAHIFSLVFAVDFPNRWPQYMHEIFLQRSFSHLPTVIFYLKTLLAIDAEVVDREIERSKDVFDRNTTIKDMMREICITECAASWCDILETVPNAEARSLALDVVSVYVDWIDVELIANERFVPLLIQRLDDVETSESALHAVEGLLQKGMPSMKKLTLSMALVDVMTANKLLVINSESAEEDVQRTGSLISVIGHALIDVHGKIEKEGGATADVTNCLNTIKDCAVTALLVLDNEDHDLSEVVIDFVRDYVFLIRDDSGTDQVSYLNRVVSISLSRYAMPSELNPDGEGEEEITFHDYRKQLKQLINPIGVKHPELVIEPMERIVAELLSVQGNMDIRKVEAIVQLVYALAEIIPANFPNSKDPWLSRAAQLPLRLVEAVPLDGRSSQVHVMYFENACRYDKILASSPQQAIPMVAEAFLDQRGIAFRVSKVRTRIVYLFVRFVKAHKAVLSPLVSQVIQRLAPLLAVSPQAEQFLSSDDQAFIFEATATLIIFGNLDVQLKSQYIEELATTLAQRFTAGLSELEAARQRSEKATIESVRQFLCAIVGYASRMSKAFNASATMQLNNCVDIFLKLLNLFLSALSPSNIFLLETTRQLSHRMIVCLDQEILPLLPSILAKLGQCSQDLDSMHSLLILCHQVIAKHKKSVMVSGVDFGVILSNAARFSADTDAISKWPHDEANKRSLVYVQRAFCQLLLTVVQNDMLNDLAPGPTSEVLLEAARRLCLGTDSACQKQSLGSICKLGVQSVQSNDDRLFELAVRTALEVPALPHLSTQDAGSQLVIHEACSSLINLRSAAPQAFDTLVTSLLPSPMATEMLSMLSRFKGKELDKLMNNLYLQIRSQQNT